jgi:hypothetical protein
MLASSAHSHSTPTLPLPCSVHVFSPQGIVFFATPHFGSNLAAMGWQLRKIPGARPAPSLARLTPGPHLIKLNDVLQVGWFSCRGSDLSTLKSFILKSLA